MKYYLTCVLALILLVLPAMAQKAKPTKKGKAPRKVATTTKPVKPEVAAKAVGAPKLVIESLEHDFGKIKEGRLTSYNFLVKNEGTGVLQIENVAPS